VGEWQITGFIQPRRVPCVGHFVMQVHMLLLLRVTFGVGTDDYFSVSYLGKMKTYDAISFVRYPDPILFLGLLRFTFEHVV